MKKCALLLTVTSVFTLLNTGSVYAGNREGAVTLTPGIAYFSFSNKRHLNDTAVAPTVALAYNFDKNWAIEAAYGVFNTSYKGSGRHGGVNGDTYTLDGLYRFAAHGMLEPYVSIGLGVFYLNPNGTDPANQVNLNAGLGAEAFFSESVALRAEVRDLYTMAGGKNDFLFNVGVSFLMGGQTTPAASLPKAASYKGDQ